MAPSINSSREAKHKIIEPRIVIYEHHIWMFVSIICFSRSPRDGPFVIIGCPCVSRLWAEPNWDVFMIVATSFAYLPSLSRVWKNNILKRAHSGSYLGAVLWENLKCNLIWFSISKKLEREKWKPQMTVLDYTFDFIASRNSIIKHERFSSKKHFIWIIERWL